MWSLLVAASRTAPAFVLLRSRLSAASAGSSRAFGRSRTVQKFGHGQKGLPHAVAEATGILTRENCRRIAEFTFEYALKHERRKVTVVHKANILKSLTGLFLETVRDVGARYAEQITLEDCIVDNCAMQLVLNPSQFDVILTTNMFGDILSDEVAGLIGGLGLAPGANIGADAAIFEAVHGSAPDIAGQNKANPTALMLSAATMLEYCGLHDRGRRLRSALLATLATPATRTGDLGGPLGTDAFTDVVLRHLEQPD